VEIKSTKCMWYNGRLFIRRTYQKFETKEDCWLFSLNIELFIFVDFRFFSFYKKFYIRIEMGEKWAEIFKHNFFGLKKIFFFSPCHLRQPWPVQGGVVSDRFDCIYIYIYNKCKHSQFPMKIFYISKIEFISFTFYSLYSCTR
jgi:hypothetical protein